MNKCKESSNRDFRTLTVHNNHFVVCFSKSRRYTALNNTHTYICHYNPSVRIIDLVSHTTYVVCANFIYKWRDLRFKVCSKRQIFEKLFHGNVASNLLRGNRRGNTFCILFWCLTWTLAFRLISQHTTC